MPRSPRMLLDNDDVLKQTLGFAETMNTDLIRDVALTPED